MKPSLGHITIDRKILKWEWYQDSNVSRVFIHLLIIANHKPGRWQGIPVGRGQTITGRIELAAALGLSESNVRTALKKLQLTKEITIKSTNKNSIVTICNYETYQSKDKKIASKLTGNQPSNQPQNQPTTNQQSTTNNNDNNDKENNNKEEEENNQHLLLNEKFLIPQMFSIFKKAIPTYPGFVDNDFQPLGKISRFLQAQLSLTGNTNDNQEQITNYWGKLCPIIAESNFYQTKSLSVIANQISEIYQIKNGKKLKSATSIPGKSLEFDRP